jgi:hypothetical protein
MSFVESYSLEAEIEQLHCHTPGGQKCQDVKLQFGVGVGEGVGTGVEQEIGVCVTVGVGLGVGQAVNTINIAMRVKPRRAFSMTTVVYDLLLGKVKHSQGVQKGDSQVSIQDKAQ